MTEHGESAQRRGLPLDDPGLTPPREMFVTAAPEIRNRLHGAPDYTLELHKRGWIDARGVPVWPRQPNPHLMLAAELCLPPVDADDMLEFQWKVKL